MATKAIATDNIDDMDWQEVAFGDVVAGVTESERQPIEAGLEFYVGLDHIEPENLTLSEWGKLDEDDVSFTKRFRKGQVLFAKRRAYQRKVAVADFDGICSSDLLTFESKNGELLPELLPFVVQSDAFFDHALDTSSGSLSPRTRWSQLKNFVFALPPLPEQKRIADLLWALEDALFKARDCVQALYRARGAFVNTALDEIAADSEVHLKDLWTESPNSGYSPSAAADDTGHYVLILSAVSKYGYVRDQLKPVRNDAKVEAASVRKGDLLISRSNTVDLVGLVGIFDEEREDVSFPDLMMRIRPDEDRLLTKFLELVLLSRRGRRHMRRVAAGTSGSMKKINRTGLGSFKVPLPSIEHQESVIAHSKLFEIAATNAQARYEALRGLKRRLLDKTLRLRR